MCVNFTTAEPAAIAKIIDDDVQGDLFASHEVWPRYAAPIIRRDKQTGKRAAEIASFGLLPPWAKEPKIPHSTMNARTETVATLASFRDAWRKSQLCLIPMKRYYEPNYEAPDGKPVRWSIARRDAPDFAVAGMWSWWAGRGEHEGQLSFTLLTMNCDEHPVLRRFHAIGDEKRSLIHVPPHEYDAWLDADPELARAMLELPDPDVLDVHAAPLPPRKKTAPSQADILH
jgi:putative SOS response-associated peptidase YedK